MFGRAGFGPPSSSFLGDVKGQGVMDTPVDPFGEYIFVHGEWRYNIGLELPDSKRTPPVVADVQPVQCRAVKANGFQCAINAREGGLCAVHERQASK